MCPRSAFALLFALGGSGLGATGCDFFQELESADSAETGETDGDTEGDAEPVEGACSVPRDDRCLNQDIIQRCDPQTKEAVAEDCGVQCGSFLNFSCVNTGAGHGCWCVEPGAQKVYSCTELEDCLQGCVLDATSECANRCFDRTNDSTIRMFGSLVHCAHDQCHDICIDSPQLCATCIDSGIREGAGECGLERSVCNEDRNDEEPYFP